MSSVKEGLQQRIINWIIQQGVSEARRDKALGIPDPLFGDPYERVTITVEKMTKAKPQFVFFNEQGEMARALFYAGEFPYQACYEVITPDGEKWRRKKIQHFTGKEPKDVKAELDWLNKQFGMNHELLTQPDIVYKQRGVSSFLHVGVVGETPLVGFEYGVDDRYSAPRALDYLHRVDLQRLPSDLVQIKQPPQAMILYAGSR